MRNTKRHKKEISLCFWGLRFVPFVYLPDLLRNALPRGPGRSPDGVWRRAGDNSVLDRAEPVNHHRDDVANGEWRRILLSASAPELDKTAVSAGAGCNDVTRADHRAAARVRDHLWERPGRVGKAIGADALVIDEYRHCKIIAVAAPVRFKFVARDQVGAEC